MRVAFIGLGVMGYPMAAHLVRCGHSVTVFNRTTASAKSWCSEFGGHSAATPGAAAAEAEITFSCVGNDDDVRDVLLASDGVVASIPEHSIVVDHTTASADVAHEVAAACAARSVAFLDAPVSGGQAGAESGQLAVMVGGSPEVFERAVPVMRSYAKAVTLIGETGAGQLAKAVNQICIAGIVQGLAEGLHFAKQAGLDPAVVIEAISKGAAQSWQMENRWETMVNGEFEFGFAVDWMRKDLAIAFAAAQENGARLDLARLVDGYYAEVQELGGERWDTSSLIARLS